MRKKRSAKNKKGQGIEGAVETVAYSTRFSAGQRDAIDKAAAVMKWSSAKFIREAAIGRAVDVLNASGEGGELRRLADLLVKQLLDPKAEVECLLADESHTFMIGIEGTTDDGFMPPVGSVKTVRPRPDELEDMKVAFETCATQFVTMILEQWVPREAGRVGYKPKVSTGELLRGMENED